MPLSLLAATDGSESAGLAVGLAVSLSRGEHLKVVAVTPSQAPTTLSLLDEIATVLGGSPGSLAAESHRRAELAAIAALDSARRAVESSLKQGEWRLSGPVDGHPAEVILEQLASPDIDAVVMGGHGHGALGRVLLGSVTDEVLVHASKPVLIARDTRADGLVVALDGTPSSERAAAMAGLLALERSLPVHLVVAHQIDSIALPVADERIEASIREAASRWAARVRACSGLGAATLDVIHGEPVHVLTAQAARFAAPLIVVGRGSDAGPARLGAVARRLAHDARVSLMVVP